MCYTHALIFLPHTHALCHHKKPSTNFITPSTPTLPLLPQVVASGQFWAHVNLHHVLCPESPPSRPFSSFRLCTTFCAACIQLQRTRDGCSAVLRRNRCTSLQDRRVQRSRSTCCGTSAAAPCTMPCALPSGFSGMHGCSTVL